jgi:hypothetical protein
MNHGASGRSLHRGFHAEVISHEKVYLAGVQNPANVERLAARLGIDIAGLSPHDAASRIMRWLKRNPQQKVSNR